MARTKAEVFIASRFEEFQALRAELTRELAQSKHLSPIDLNDGYARHRAPLAECLSRVRAAEFFVLLLGGSYGPSAPGRSESFTHLEYAEAVREGSKTRVLVYRLKSPAPAGERPLPEGWLREIEERHTCSTLANPDPSVQASEIAKHLGAALFDLLEAADADGELDEDPADDAFDDSEVDALDAVEAGARGEDGEEAEVEQAEAAKRGPAAIAALEQRNEAVRGTALGEYGIAILHLRKALELRPLDDRSNFLLARLYVALNRQDRLGEASNLAERAARIAADEQLPYRASNAYIVAARARVELGHPADAHRLIDLALSLKPDFAKAHLQRARIFCREKKRGEAIDSVRAAFQFHNPSLRQALRDPHLSDIRDGLRELLRKETSRWREEVQHVYGVERHLRALADDGPLPIDESSLLNQGLSKLRQLGRDSIARQRELVSMLLAAAERRYRDSLPETRGSTAAATAARIGRAEQALAAAEVAEQAAVRTVNEASHMPRLLDAAVVAPLIAAGLLYVVLPWTLVAVALGVVCAAATLRSLWQSKQRLATAREQLAAATQRREEATQLRAQLATDLADERAQLESLREAGETAKRAAKQALDTFEARSLSMPGRYQPYSNLRRAQPGKLVRISRKAVEQFESNYRRRVERDEAGFWIGVEGEGNLERFALYRVAAASPGGIRLSRGRAYEPSRDSARLAGLSAADTSGASLTASQSDALAS